MGHHRIWHCCCPEQSGTLATAAHSAVTTVARHLTIARHQLSAMQTQPYMYCAGEGVHTLFVIQPD
jgi:hypothetical protein